MGLLGWDHKKSCSFQPVSWNTISQSRQLPCNEPDHPEAATWKGHMEALELIVPVEPSHPNKVSDMGMNWPIGQVNIFKKLPSLPMKQKISQLSPAPFLDSQNHEMY